MSSAANGTLLFAHRRLLPSDRIELGDKGSIPFETPEPLQVPNSQGEFRYLDVGIDRFCCSPRTSIQSNRQLRRSSHHSNRQLLPLRVHAFENRVEFVFRRSANNSVFRHVLIASEH